MKTLESEPLILGVDYGTTFTKLARVDDTGRLEVVRSNGRDLQLPTTVQLTKKGPEFGQRAINYALADPDNFHAEFKRFLGEVDSEGNPVVMCIDPATGKERTTPDLVAMYLRHVKETVESELQAEVGASVLTVPAYFTDRQRRQAKQASEDAGLKPLELLDEPVAAAMSYHAEHKKDGEYLVFDLGGGTFDATIVSCEGSEMKVRATDGDSKLGGCDLDMALTETVLERFRQEHGYSPDPIDDAQDLHDLTVRVRGARHDLSETDCVVIVARFRTNQTTFEMSRKDFESLALPTLEKTIDIAKRCLAKANMEPSDLDGILLVGGSTRTPVVESMVKKSFARPVMAAVDREFCVAKGAANWAVQLGRQSQDRLIASVAGALPACEFHLTNKTSHPLSIVLADPMDPKRKRTINQVMIPEQSDIPAKIVECFSPSLDNQPAVKIELTQGENLTAVEAGSVLGGADLKLDPPLPILERSRTIEVEYELTNEGLVNVTAKDLKSANVATFQVSLAVA